eukprot:6091927-Alexandrium_andersonii.AAC.1
MRLAKHAGQFTDGLAATMHEIICVLMAGTRSAGLGLFVATSIRWRGVRMYKLETGTSRPFVWKSPNG